MTGQAVLGVGSIVRVTEECSHFGRQGVVTSETAIPGIWSVWFGKNDTCTFYDDQIKLIASQPSLIEVG